jgi:crotonobetainyl-CoA:carnitine CoA-transferase CaiB-like acyl-CoA transferase
MLDGLTVLAIEQAVAAPFATRQLADLGARVIKIERPGGDFARRYDSAVGGESSYFVWLNRGKESLELDLKSPRAAEIVERLLERSDVFVHNLAPGAIERLGFGAAKLLPRYPRLVCCAISGYGDGGPFRDRKAYDLLIQCEVGLLSVTGTPETPSRVGISVADIAGGMYAFSGVLAALYERERTGRGTSLKVSLFDALAEWMSQPAYYARYGPGAPIRSGGRHATIAPYGPITAADGEVMFLAVQTEVEWEALCGDVLDRPSLAGDPRFATNTDRVAHRDALEAELSIAFGALTAAELAARLESANIATARPNSLAEFAEHPQLAARDRWSDVAIPGGSMRALRPPLEYDGYRSPMRAVPAAGADTARILNEIGLGESGR